MRHNLEHATENMRLLSIANSESQKLKKVQGSI